MKVEWIFATVFVTSVAWIAWVGFGYPIVIRWLASFAGPRKHPTPTRIPSVSFLVPCRNEEDFAVKKAENLRAVGMRLPKWEAFMIDDSSTDRTGEILGRIEGNGISIVKTPRRSGKIEALRLGAKWAHGEILVFTDCATRIDPSSIQPMLAWFSDPKVGLVTGSYSPTPASIDSRAQGEMHYWDSEMRLREAESALGSTTHATGALLAVRSDLFRKVEWPVGTINDDIHLPLRIIEQGYDVVCEASAIASESVETDPESEFRRRVRISAGNFQTVREIPRMAKASRWFPLFQLLSHKLMRNALGIPLAGLFVACAGMASEPFFLALFVAQFVAYLAAYLGYKLQGRILLPSILSRAIYAGAAICASMVGMVRWWKGRTQVAWERTDRLAGVGNA